MTTFARLKHDTQRASMNYKPRGISGALTAETFPLQSKPDGVNKGDPINYSDTWYKFDAALSAHNWTMGVHNWLFNTEANPQRAESISTGGNVVEIDSFQNNHAHILSFNNASNPAEYGTDLDYAHEPQLVHKVVCIQKNGIITNPGAGLDAYNALIGSPDLFVNMQDIELFPALGPVTINANALPWLNVRQYAYGPAIGKVYPLQKVVIARYNPVGSDVWGQIQMSNGLWGWIALQINRTFYTSWRMATIPPIPPKS